MGHLIHSSQQFPEQGPVVTPLPLKGRLQSRVVESLAESQTVHMGTAGLCARACPSPRLQLLAAFLHRRESHFGEFH